MVENPKNYHEKFHTSSKSVQKDKRFVTFGKAENVKIGCTTIQKRTIFNSVILTS